MGATEGLLRMLLGASANVLTFQAGIFHVQRCCGS